MSRLGEPTRIKAAPRRSNSNLGMTIGFAAIVLFFVASGALSYWNIKVLDEDGQRVAQSHELISSLNTVLSTMKDAETGQRGYVITGQQSYLEPYLQAKANLDEELNTLARLSAGSPSLTSRLPSMKTHIEAKMAELAETIELRRTKSFEAAKAVVVTDKGKTEMDAFRNDVDATGREEQAIREQRLKEMADATNVALGSEIVSGILGVALSCIVAFLITRAIRGRMRQEWLQTGQVGLSQAMFGEQRLEHLTENILKFLAEYLDAHAGAFYTLGGSGFTRLAIYGVPADGVPDHFDPGEGLLGQAAKDNRAFVIRDVPEGYVKVSSALGQAAPRQLVVVPTTIDGTVNSVFELGFVHPLHEAATDLLETVADSIGIAIRSAKDRSRLQDLLEETQRQSEELQVQSEELRVSNEELEEQSRALKESQARLEQQQVELEQTNSQLEEQTQQLEVQRDDLSKTKGELEDQARDLERTSRFKSDFLANMSHELRTPLNSSLILAKLLAENREGNLSEEQIKYAETIQSAGNDLLALIGDVLDLSKIEAGHMEVRVEKVVVDEALESLRRAFQPVAEEKALSLEVRRAPGAPESIETDPQRLEQVLKNLMSNAFKFTEKGGVTVEARAAENGWIAFSVTDTGIGIAEEQKEMVFEAFRQADGTTNRRFGGTGLGLSISRELAHLLGGEISLTSEPGKGSVFTATIPVVLTPSRPASRKPGPTTQPVRARPASATVATIPNTVGDDRDELTGSGRVIMVVEDDVAFARILCDLAREHQFQCLIATSAEEALALATQHLPSAVLLDIGLPDNSGLLVLDRLKHDQRTRHIPVHVVSGSDHSHTAMALGAAGYMLKPIKREEISKAFEDVERIITQRLRRVLLVEDDAVQLESLKKLLASRDVETVGAASAAECLSLLSQNTFDCMVLDLSLPDASGFSLLETLSKEEAYAFPPVIVYTGRELSPDEEQRLRRYSRSIIVKGVKSPERLLDEVTLFLHQVVSELPADKQRLIEKAKLRDADLEDRLILVAEDDIRNIYALTSILEPRGAKVEIARNGREAIEVLQRTPSIDLVLMDIMMPEMDGLAAMREIRRNPDWAKLPIIALTAKAMKNDQEECLAAGANDYIAKPLDVDKLLSLVRVWIPRD